MRIFTLGCAFFIFASTNILAQSPVAVNPLTGRASMSIPIWTVKSGDLGVPIELSYIGGGGMKVNGGEGNAGVGWLMSAGGAVERELRGFPDDYVGAFSNNVRNGWLHGNNARQVNNFTPSGDFNYNTCADEAADFNTLHNMAYIDDTEPDIFFFHAPGLQGGFVFDHYKNIRTVPYQDLKIEVTRSSVDSLIAQIDITTNLGVKYTFQAGTRVQQRVASGGPAAVFETTYQCYKEPIVYYASFYLAQMRSPMGGVINLHYSGLIQDKNITYSRAVNNTSQAIDTTYSVEQNISGQLLSRITGSNEEATFEWNGTLITSVKIRDRTFNDSREFNMEYKAVNSRGSTLRKPVKRNFLRKFHQEVNCSSFPGHHFEYHGMNLNTSASHSQAGTFVDFSSLAHQDLFGYYDSTATSAVPDIYIKAGDTGSDGERYRIAPAPGYTVIPGGGRTVNPGRVFYGTLKSVTLPSGAKTEIAYEPNEYYDELAATNQYGAGVRVKSISTLSGNSAADVITKYRYRHPSLPRSSGSWVYRPMFAYAYGGGVTRVPDNIAPDESILYSHVEEITSGRGRRKYEFQVAGMFGEVTNGDYNATLSRLAREHPGDVACSSLGNLRHGYYTFPFPVNTNYDFKRGLPSRVAEYTADYRPVSEVRYTYQQTTLPMAKVSGIKYEFFNTVYQFGKYEILSNINSVKLTETSRVYDQGDISKYAETTTTYTLNGNQMISQEATANSDNSTRYTNYYYAKDYAAGGTDTQSQMIYSLVNSNRHATPVEMVQKAGNVVTGASLTLFNNTFGDSRILPSKKLALTSAATFSPASVSGGVFTYSNLYRTALDVEAYNDLGFPTITRDRSRKVTSVITGFNNKLPTLTISNARPEEVLYADFEGADGLSYTGSVAGSTESWTGTHSIAMNGGASLYRDNITRGKGRYYRFRCWVKASGAGSLDVQVYASGGSPISNIVNYLAAGSWQFVEKRIDAGAISAGGMFTMKLVTSGAVNIDNIAFYPESADIVAHAYQPLNGKTSEAGSRADVVFKEYDGMGREYFVKNQDKDIIQITDYHYKLSAVQLPESRFTSAPDISAITMLTNVVFTAVLNCVPGEKYEWYVDDVLMPATGPTLTYRFSQNKDYYVKLVVSSTQGNTTSETKIHPIAAINASMALAPGESTQVDCRDAGERTFTIILSDCFEPNFTTFHWYYYYLPVHNVPQLIPLTETTSNVVTLPVPMGRSAVVVCNITSRCYNSATGAYDTVTTSVSKNFTWRVVSPC